MKRRTFGWMTAWGAAALGAGTGIPKPARAATSADLAATLKTTLTPFGAERAGNADGSIPAWTGGLTTPPEGWTPDQAMPIMFPDEKPILKIDASNMNQYKDQLAEGAMIMMQKYGFYINVYPTHRTAAAPQWVYDNIYQNALNAQPVSGDARLGFTGAYGGVAFPIPDLSDPKQGGAQIIWNHLTRWMASHWAYDAGFYVMSNGALTLENSSHFVYMFDYYQQDGNVANYNGYYYRGYLQGLGPASNQGSQLIIWVPTNPSKQEESGWQYLSGQGRVRKIPEEQYDIPESEDNGVTVYDEVYDFFGSPDRFDWTVIGKKEMYIPYNSDQVSFLTPADYLPYFINPEKIRWELHRVWVVEATLHEGDRNIIPRRRFYIDEDTWTGVLADEYDAQGNYWVFNNYLMVNRPDLPSALPISYVEYNIQQGNYAHQATFVIDYPAAQRTMDVATKPDLNLFNPQTMSAQSQF